MSQRIVLVIVAVLLTPGLPSFGQKIYWVDSELDRIQRANLDGTAVEDLVTTGLVFPTGLALDVASGQVYWTDQYSDKIQRAHLDGANVEDVVTSGLAHARSIAFDFAEQKIYWLDRSINAQASLLLNTISRSNFDGSSAEVLLVSGLDDARDLALDVSAGKFYVTDHGANSIKRANLDGTGLETVIGGVASPLGIALDVSAERIYWTSADTGEILRGNFDGTSIETIVTELGVPSSIALDMNAAKIYWTDTSTRKIQRAGFDGTQVEDVVPAGSQLPIKIALDSNPCVTDYACSDGDPCTLGLCTLGSCSASEHTGPCNDRNPCTTGDSCASGSCEGQAADGLPCDDGVLENRCTEGVCSDSICIPGPAVPGYCPVVRVLATEVNGAPCPSCPTSSLPDSEVFPGDEITFEFYVSDWDLDFDRGRCRNLAVCSVAAQDCAVKFCEGTEIPCLKESDCATENPCRPDTCRPFPVLDELQWRMPVAGFTNESDGALVPASLSCTADADCWHGYSNSTQCTCAFSECSEEDICTLGSVAFIDEARDDYIFSGLPRGVVAGQEPVAPENLFWLQGLYDSLGLFEGLNDDGSAKYAGTVILDASLDARGTYLVDLDPVDVFYFNEVIYNGATVNICDVSVTVDCNQNTVPDECERDCNSNGVPDECDIAENDPDGNGEVSDDGNGNGIPDECFGAPLPASAPHRGKKNRYLSFRPSNIDREVAMRVTLTASLYSQDAVGSIMWVDEPDVDGFAVLSEMPVVRLWPEPIVHASGCFIAPATEYEIVATPDGGVTRSNPLAIRTVDRPGDVKFWGDVVGFFDGLRWTGPQGVTNIDDALAAVLTFQQTIVATHIAITDVAPQAPNHIVNINDVFMILLAFQGAEYPYGCLDDPCQDNIATPCP